MFYFKASIIFDYIFAICQMLHPLMIILLQVNQNIPATDKIHCHLWYFTDIYKNFNFVFTRNMMNIMSQEDLKVSMQNNDGKGLYRKGPCDAQINTKITHLA